MRRFTIHPFAGIDLRRDAAHTVAMKRYLVFDYDMYYPQGGTGDFIGQFDDPEEARSFKASAQFRDILDIQTGMQMHGRNGRSGPFQFGPWVKLEIQC